MSMIVYPCLAGDRKRYWIGSRNKVGPVFRYAKQVLIKDVVFDVVNDTRCSIVGSFSLLSLTCGDRYTSVVLVLRDLRQAHLTPIVRVLKTWEAKGWGGLAFGWKELLEEAFFMLPEGVELGAVRCD